MIWDGRSVSRSEACAALEIGEGSMRRLVDLMKGYGLVDVGRFGISIRPAGRNMVGAMGIRFADVSAPGCVIGEFSFSLVVAGAAGRVGSGTAQRDAGIRSGGSGCTTWVIRGGKLLMAPEWDVDANDPRSAAAIRGSVSLAEGDALVIGGGPTLRDARAAAVGAALSLVG
ncbi:hypothetical protein AUQ37_03510 [Candidatus Methanomethylophilus sp. 1R26]|nr:hypothetical protein AUQ37_03510 [Candidatus Methanomethylophilus sp. 1R26]